MPGCYDPLRRKGSRGIRMSVTPPVHTAVERALNGMQEVVAMSAQPMMFPVAREGVGRVLVTDGVVYVRELDEADDEVVRVVAESDDPVAAVSHCLRVGRGRCGPRT